MGDSARSITLMGDKMNLEDMLKQAEKDRDAIEANIQSLKDQIEATKIKPRNGDIVENNLGFTRLIVNIPGLGWYALARNEKLQSNPKSQYSVQDIYNGKNPLVKYKVIGNVFDERS